MAGPLSDEELGKIDAYWRAANYLSIGQIYLKDNPLLERPLTREDIKPRLLGHFGTTPGLNFIYVHLNRIIRNHRANMMYLIGPGHGAPGIIANTFLEGSYTELYPNIERNRDGMKRLFRQFSWPYGVPSHDAPEVPGSISEGGELGYALLHAYGAVLDNPDLIVPCVVGDGEAETGALAASWHSNKFINPITDGAVLPILHLNGYKIANPTVLARIDHDELEALFKGYGYTPYFLEGDDPKDMHQRMAQVLDTLYAEITRIQRHAREKNDPTRPRWPMLVLRTPKGWTGPKVVDGKPVEGTWRAHQVPLEEVRDNPEHLKILEEWLHSYRPRELFDANGTFREELADIAPKGRLRMGVNVHSNGGQLLVPLVLPAFRDYAVDPGVPGSRQVSATRVLGGYLRDVMRHNLATRNFRMFAPDENASNRLQDVYAVSGKAWDAKQEPTDENLSVDGRVMEVLSEHLCQGWLEGYLLTGRHGFFSCYEAFIHIIDSMFNQHAKWIKSAKELPWRKPIASLNYLLSSHVWRQDHNGFSHQDPGFIDHVANKKADTVRIYLPPDANTLLSVTDHCLRSKNYVNLIIAGKQLSPVWLDMESAVRHCAAGIGAWDWAGNDDGDPDVVMACAGDVPTMETLAAVTLLREWAPELKVRVVNVVDVFTLAPVQVHPHGLNEEDFNRLFTTDKPVVFAFHGYPTLVHKLTYNRANHGNIHVHGFKEEGTTTTPFDMTVLNDMDRFTLALDAIRHSKAARHRLDDAEQRFSEVRQRHKLYVSEHGEDMPEVADWKWTAR
ncbi:MULTISPECIES: phosphoketolase family protein [unclassified Corallococcus]|uniref:phosphoketolase family protein n=1 Tax=unclassified Corallococcus TaxID=2685029 RepID=UPI001A8CA981|nr:MULTISPECIES: phosphoketolase family protein [unclassified Corallococcus]MBN9684218.1 phosphoketolase family protein [Corallococcus sp. NCSPR001]WAS84295.1 phosphoketolase family protein [Corallococcus sp. NCRR]